MHIGHVGSTMKPESGSRKSRRFFLSALTGLTATASRWSKNAWAAVAPVSDSIIPSREDIEAVLRRRFDCDDPKLWNLLIDAYRFCILGKLRKAEPPFQHDWLIPGGVYNAQWIWDTMFVVDLLSILPNQQTAIRGIFQNYWDFQKRWNERMPRERRGFIANYIAPNSGPERLRGTDWLTFPAFSQAPLLAWGMERVFRRNGDIQMLRAGISPLEQFHDWFWRERDLQGTGLISVGDYSGSVQRARYETYDNEVDLDTLVMTSHPTRHGIAAGRWYGNICIPANTAYLLQSEASLVSMAQICGDQEMAQRRRARLAKGIAGMRNHMWNEEQGCFMAVYSDTLRQVTAATVGGFVPIMAGVPTMEQAEKMAATLRGSRWATPIPVPTVARDDPNYVSDAFWRGDVWPAPTFQVVSGLAHYGHKDLAAKVANKVLDNAMAVGISEHYDSQSGKALGVANLGMSAVLVTMAIDGLSDKYTVRVLAH